MTSFKKKLNNVDSIVVNFSCNFDARGLYNFTSKQVNLLETTGSQVNLAQEGESLVDRIP